MRILITGMSGFTGKHLSAKLEELGHKIFSLEVDLLDLEAVNHRIKEVSPEAVAHLAAISFVDHGTPTKTIR